MFVTMTAPEVAKIPQTDEDAPLALLHALSNPPGPRDQPPPDDAEPWDHPRAEDDTDDGTQATPPAEATTPDYEEGDPEELAHNDKPPLPGGDQAWFYGGLDASAQDIIKQLEQFDNEHRNFLEDPEVITFLQQHCTYNPIVRFLVGKHIYRRTHIEPALFWSAVDGLQIFHGDFDYGRAYTAAELVALPNIKIRYIVDGVFARKSIDMISGLPKSGKSSLVRDLLHKISAGKTWLGREIAAPMHVGYICLEDPPELYRAAVSTMMGDVTSPTAQEQLQRIYLLFHVRPERLIPTIEGLVEQGCQIVFIDTLIRAIGACDNVRYGEMIFKTDPLLLLAKRYSINITVLHHHTKSADGSDAITSAHGSIAITGSVSHIISLNRPDDVGPTTIHSRNRYSGAGLGGHEFKGETLNYNEQTGEFWLSPPPLTKTQQRRAKTLQVPFILADLLIQKFQESNGQEGLFINETRDRVRQRLKQAPEYGKGVKNDVIDKAVELGKNAEWFEHHPRHHYNKKPALTIHHKFWGNIPALKAEMDEYFCEQDGGDAPPSPES